MYKVKELTGSAGKHSRRHQEDPRGRGKDSQELQNENPAHIFAVSRQQEAFKDTVLDPKSSLVSLQIDKSLLVPPQHGGLPWGKGDPRPLSRGEGGPEKALAKPFHLVARLIKNTALSMLPLNIARA